MAITDRSLAPQARRLLLDLLTAATEAPTAQRRLELLIDGFTALLDGEVGGFNHVDVFQARAIVMMRPQVLTDPSGAIQQALADHPVVLHYRKIQTPTPLVLSSCSMGRWRRWKDHPTYSVVFKPMGTPHQIVIPLPWASIPLQIGAAYAVTRSGSDFGNRDLGVAQAARELLCVLHDGDGALCATGRLELLTTAERNVLELYGLGLTEGEIAGNRGTGRETVRTQLRTGCAKLQLAGPGRRRAVAQVFGHVPPASLPADRLARILDA